MRHDFYTEEQLKNSKDMYLHSTVKLLEWCYNRRESLSTSAQVVPDYEENYAEGEYWFWPAGNVWNPYFSPRCFFMAQCARGLYPYSRTSKST